MCEQDGRDALDIVAVYDNVDIADIILKRRLSHSIDTVCLPEHTLHVVLLIFCVSDCFYVNERCCSRGLCVSVVC